MVKSEYNYTFFQSTDQKVFLNTLLKPVQNQTEEVLCAPESAHVHRNERPPSSLGEKKKKTTSAGHHCRKQGEPLSLKAL